MRMAIIVGLFLSVIGGVLYMNPPRSDFETYAATGIKEEKRTYKLTKKQFLDAIPKEIPTKYHKILLETAIYESGLTQGQKQKNGPALGIMQIEPNTHLCIYQNYLAYRDKLGDLVEKYGNYNNIDLQYNLSYNILMAFLVYYRKLGNKVDLSEKHMRAFYYKQVYNTKKGKGSIEGYLYGR